MPKKKPSEAVAEEELERLYLQPPERFTETRNALAKRLREDGDREAAEEIRKLRKPSVPAWLVNQLGLREPAEVKKLLDAGERLREAEDAMLAGRGDGEDLREAAAAERAAVERLVSIARDIAAADDRKLNRAALDRVAETLQAAGADEEIADAVREGRLAKEQKRATIGVSTRAPSSKRAAGGTKEAKASRDRAEAKAAVEAARRDLERAEGVVERAQSDVDVHAQRLKEAKDDLASAKRHAKSAAAELRRAQARAKKG